MARSNTLEGGTNGVTLTQGSGGNTGATSGDFFNNVDNGSGVGTVAFSSAQAAHGSRSMTTSTPASSSLAYAGWTLSAATSDVCREYCRFVSLPSAATQPVLRYLSTGSQAYRVNVKTGGALEIRDAGNNVIGTTTSVISAGSWFRLELTTTFSATVGAIALRLYLSPDSTSISDSLTLSGLTLTASSNDLRFGVGSAMANAVQVFYDDLATEGATWHGPALRSITLSGIAVPAALGGTALAQDFSITPSGIAVPAALGAQAAGQDLAVTPSGIGLQLALGGPGVDQQLAVTPSGIAIPTGLGSPTIAQALTVVPDGLAVPIDLGAADIAQPMSVMLAGIAVPALVGDPGVVQQAVVVIPDGIAVPIELGGTAVSMPGGSVTRPDTGTITRPTPGTIVRPDMGVIERP